MISWWLSKEKNLDIKEFNRNPIKRILLKFIIKFKDSKYYLSKI